jgi:glycosyltransferase involved in cell wall biosynthesis
VSAIHQFVPAVFPGDATGAHTLHLRRLLRDEGNESEIFTEAAHPDLADEVFSAEELDGDAPVIYQFSIGSVLADHLLARDNPVIVDYHNLTPAEFFSAWQPELMGGIEWGVRQRVALADRAVLGIADSRFNELDLIADGYQETRVAPVLVDPTEWSAEPDTGLVERLADRSGSHWLFVGRVAPHKAQHDVIRALAFHRRHVDPAAHVSIVGGPSSDRYWRAMQSLVDELDLGDAVALPGSVSGPELAAYFTTADVFVSASEHEGFGVPLLEAMHHDVPVVAFGAAAVPETVGDGGLVLDDKSPAVLSSAIARVLADDDLHTDLVAAGRTRVVELGIEAGRRRMLEALGPVLGSG